MVLLKLPPRVAFFGGVSEPVKTVNGFFLGDDGNCWGLYGELSAEKDLFLCFARAETDIPKGLLLLLEVFDLPLLDRGVFPPDTRALNDFLRRDSGIL